MTEDLSVQQRPSAIPYLLGGVAAGGLGGYFVDKIPGFNGVPKAKYSSFEDIMKESKDFFTKTDGMSEELQKAAGKIQAERENVVQYIKDNVKNAKFDEKLKAEAQTALEKQTAFKEATTNALTDIKNQIKGKAIPIEGLDINNEADVAKAAKKYLKEHLNEDAFKGYKDALEACKNANKALRDKAAKEGVANHKVIEGLSDKMQAAWKNVEKEASQFKTGNKWWNAAIGAAALGTLAVLLLRPKNKEQ